jgi:hypothetical protein
MDVRLQGNPLSSSAQTGNAKFLTQVFLCLFRPLGSHVRNISFGSKTSVTLVMVPFLLKEQGIMGYDQRSKEFKRNI